MRFGLSEEQRMLQDSLRRFLDDACPLEHVREVAEAHGSHSESVWRGLVELGIPGLLIPEEHGGVGFSQLHAAVAADALGAAVAPVPFVASVVMAPTAINAAASDAQKASWLPAIASGELRLGVGVSEVIGARHDAGVECKDGTLRGRALFVLDAGAANAFIVASSDRRLHFVAADAPGLTYTPLKTVDRTRVVGELSFSGTPAETLPGSDDPGVLDAVIRAGRVMLAADTVGAAQTMLDKAVAYAKERKQFDRVIASFQAVKHMCAEMAANLEPCRALTWYAAHALDAVPEDAALYACHAKAHTSEVGRFVAKTATEVHGGMGFTDLLGLHYWFKRIGANRQWLGAPELVRDEAARLQGWVA